MALTDSQEFEELQAWLQGDRPSSTAFLEVFRLSSLQRALSWAVMDLKENIDDELKNVAEIAGKIGLRVDGVRLNKAMFVEYRLARVEDISREEALQLDDRDEAVTLLDDLREEMAWVKAEISRMEMHTNIGANQRAADPTRKSFGFVVSPRAYEVRAAKAKAMSEGRENANFEAEAMLF